MLSKYGHYGEQHNIFARKHLHGHELQIFRCKIVDKVRNSAEILHYTPMYHYFNASIQRAVEITLPQQPQWREEGRSYYLNISVSVLHPIVQLHSVSRVVAAGRKTTYIYTLGEVDFGIRHTTQLWGVQKYITRTFCQRNFFLFSELPCA